MCITSDQMKHTHFQVVAKERKADWTFKPRRIFMYESVLANVMIGICTIVATTLQMVTVGIFFTGIGLMSLHAFGLVSPPL